LFDKGLLVTEGVKEEEEEEKGEEKEKEEEGENRNHIEVSKVSGKVCDIFSSSRNRKKEWSKGRLPDIVSCCSYQFG
jgi:hypothetical protein